MSIYVAPPYFRRFWWWSEGRENPASIRATSRGARHGNTFAAGARQEPGRPGDRGDGGGAATGDGHGRAEQPVDRGLRWADLGGLREAAGGPHHSVRRVRA